MGNVHSEWIFQIVRNFDNFFRLWQFSRYVFTDIHRVAIWGTSGCLCILTCKNVWLFFSLLNNILFRRTQRRLDISDMLNRGSVGLLIRSPPRKSPAVPSRPQDSSKLKSDLREFAKGLRDFNLFVFGAVLSTSLSGTAPSSRPMRLCCFCVACSRLKWGGAMAAILGSHGVGVLLTAPEIVLIVSFNWLPILPVCALRA